MLTARDDTDDIIKGLDSGADDYIVKPFKMEELLARVRALLRRKDKVIEQVIQIDHLQLHVDSRVFLYNNKVIDLTKNEFLLLEYLFMNKGRILTREQICIYIWGYDYDVSNNSLDALVKLVRKKIDDGQSKSHIQNVRGIGYKLRDNECFRQREKKLAYINATLYFLLFSLFVIVLYFSLVKLMENQQMKELEDFYVKQEHDFF